MAINLQKGQRVDLTKGNPGLSKIMVGLGWDPVQKAEAAVFWDLYSEAAAVQISTAMLLLSCLVKMESLRVIKMLYISVI